MVLTIAAAIFALGIVVLVHEWGHFVTAKAAGMRVDEFAIGFGPKILAFTRGETVYSVRLVPLGGFTDIAGMDKSINDAGERGYCEKSLLARSIVILAGVAMNFILPIFLFLGIYLTNGVSTPNPDPILGEVLSGRPADVAGLKAGDRILRVDGKPVATWSEFVAGVRDQEREVVLTYERDGAEGEVRVTPAYDSNAKHYLVGVVSAVNTWHPEPSEAMVLAVKRVGSVLESMLQQLVHIVAKLEGENLAGPIGVAQMAGEVAQMGFVPLLNFVAMLSLNLGIVNLFPIPGALDGGKFVMLVLEGIRGEPLGEKAFQVVQITGVVMLLMLMVLATKNDVVRVILGGS